LQYFSHEIIGGAAIGIALSASVWIFCMIKARTKAKEKRILLNETIEKIYHILGAVSRNAEFQDEDENVKFIKSAKDLMNKNMQILGTDFMILLDKHLQLLKVYVKMVSKPIQASAPQPKTAQTHVEIPVEKQSQTHSEHVGEQTDLLAQTKSEEKQTQKHELPVDTDTKPASSADKFAIKIGKRLSHGLFPTAAEGKPDGESDSEKTSYLLNATQEFQMKDILR